MEGARVVDGTVAPDTGGLSAATLVWSGVGGRTAGVEVPGIGTLQARRYASWSGVNGEAIPCGRWMQESGDAGLTQSTIAESRSAEYSR